MSFANCESLTDIIIPNSVTFIGVEAFFRCISLTSIDIPNSVTHLGKATFGYCSGLESVIIPSSLTSIEDFAFAICSNLASVTYITDAPISCNSNIFDTETYQNAELNIPEGTSTIFKAVDPWKNFSKIKALPTSGIFEMSADLDMTLPYEVYNLNGVKVSDSVESLPTGIYVVCQGNKVMKVAIK